MSEETSVITDLVDFSENAPENFISVYTRVNKGDLESIKEKGLSGKFRKDRLSEDAKALDRQIKEEAAKIGKPDFERENCIFAYPFNPNISPPPEYYPEDGDVVLEAKVSPDSWVAGIPYYEYAQQTSGAARLSHIIDYVEKAVKLREYLKRQKNIPSVDDTSAYVKYISDGGWVAFDNPEVLVSENIPTKFIRIASKN